jgi:hypothetical protein
MGAVPLVAGSRRCPSLERTLMANKIPCPNPACTHVFALAELQASAALCCPRCGFRMQGRGKTVAAAPAAPAKPSASPSASPAATVIVAQIAASPPASALPVRPEPARPTAARPLKAPAAKIDVKLVTAPAPAAPVIAAPVVAPSGNRVVVVPPATPPTDKPAPRRGDGTRAVMRLLLVLGVIAAAFCLVATGLVVIVTGFGFMSFDDIVNGRMPVDVRAQRGDYQAFTGNARNLRGTEEKAFKLLLAKNSWAPDKELKTQLAANWAWMNKQDDVWLAVAVKDYGTQKPREAELLQLGIERLEQRFGENLELAAKAEPLDFAGAPAQKLTFKGTLGAVVWWGECITLTHHGFGYWIYLGGPTSDEVEPFEAELKKEETGFSLVTDRKGWREQPPRTESFASSDGVLTVTAVEGVWEKAGSATGEYDTGTLLLLGRYLKERDNQKNAHLQTFTLEKQTDAKEAMKLAKEHIEKVKKEQTSGYKLAAASDAAGQSELGVVEDIGNRRGRIAELMLSVNDNAMRYYLVAVISEGDQVHVVLCECNWKSRQIWRQEFLGLFKAMKVRAK